MTKKKMCIAAACIATIPLALFMGCAEHTEDVVLSSENENVPLVSSRTGIQLTDDGIFFGGLLNITFYDFETRESQVICPLSDCSHSDESCPASFAELGDKFALYRGDFYALTERRVDLEWRYVYTFKARSQLDSEWEILWTQQTALPGSVSVRIWNGYAIILANEVVSTEEAGVEVVSHSQLVSVELSTNTINMVIPEFEWEHTGSSYRLIGVADRKAIVWWTGFPEEPTSLTEFAAQNELTEDEASGAWIQYFNERRFNKIITIDLDTGARVEVASGSSEILPSFNYLLGKDIVYRGVIYFYYNGAITAHSVQSGETWELLSISNVVNWFVFDGRVFVIALSESGEVSLNYYALESGDVYELSSAGSGENLTFLPLHENSTMFLGFKEGTLHLIYKVDFYSENFDEAKRLDLRG